MPPGRSECRTDDSLRRLQVVYTAEVDVTRNEDADRIALVLFEGRRNVELILENGVGELLLRLHKLDVIAGAEIAVIALECRDSQLRAVVDQRIQQRRPEPRPEVIINIATDPGPAQLVGGRAVEGNDHVFGGAGADPQAGFGLRADRF